MRDRFWHLWYVGLSIACFVSAAVPAEASRWENEGALAAGIFCAIAGAIEYLWLRR